MSTEKKDVVMDYVLGWCATANWHAGARLPSIASMVAHLGVAKNTVIAALQELAHQGVIESRERAGYFIRRRRQKTKARIPQLTDFQGDRLEHGMAVVTLASQNIAINDVGGGTPAPSLIGTPAWLAELKQAPVRNLAETSNYSDPLGLSHLREAIAGSEFLTAGAEVNPDNVLITHGGSEALMLAARWAIGQRGIKRLAVENPGYYLLYPMLAMLGIETVPIPRVHQELDIEYLRRMLHMGPIAGIIINTNHHNPLGGDLSHANLESLACLAERESFSIIEDDAYRGLWADKPEVSSLFSQQANGNIYISTFSKTLGAGLRVGFMVSTAAVIKDLRAMKFMTNLCGDVHVQEMLAHFINSRRYADHLSSLRMELKRRAKIAQVQASAYAELGTFDGPYTGGLYQRFVFQRPLAMAALYSAAKANGIIISPDEFFYATEMEVRANPSWMRVNISACEQERLSQVLAFIHTFINKQEVKALAGTPSPIACA